VLAALPPRAGFGHPFAARAQGRLARPSSLAAGLPFGARQEQSGPGASRRLLQPEQSTSTTTRSTDPRPLRRHGAPSLRWAGRKPPDGVEAIRHANHWIRVMPPDAPRHHRSSLAARAAKYAASAGAEAPSDTSGLSPAEVSRARGQPALAAWRLPSGLSHVRDTRVAGHARKRARDESFAPTRSARAPHVARSRRTRWRA